MRYDIRMKLRSESGALFVRENRPTRLEDVKIARLANGGFIRSTTAPELAHARQAARAPTRI